MWAYILKRILLMVPTLLGVLLVTFVVIQFVPGGPVEQVVSQLSGRTAGGEPPSRVGTVVTEQRNQSEGKGNKTSDQRDLLQKAAPAADFRGPRWAVFEGVQ